MLGQANLNGLNAVFNTTALAPGSHSITATYSGDTLYSSSTSAPTIATIAAAPDFIFTADHSSATSQTVTSGQPAIYHFSVQVPDGSLKTPITFTVTGLPEGAIAAFSPETISKSGSITLTVQTSSAMAWTIPLMLVTGLAWKKADKRRMIAVFLIAFLSMMQACGSGSKPLSRSYTITVNANATSVNGVVLQHSTTFTLTMM